MPSIETSVSIYVGFVVSLVVLQAGALLYYLCVYDCCYLQTNTTRLANICRKICPSVNFYRCQCKPARLICTKIIRLFESIHERGCRKNKDLLDPDTKELPLIEGHLYDQL